MPIIRVEMFEGRDIGQKRELVKELTDAFVRTYGGSQTALTIAIDDVKKRIGAVVASCVLISTLTKQGLSL